MNLTKLFETQKLLDERIVKEKGLEGQDLLPEKILALLTELGELSNEWQGFKFWKENKEPRTLCPLCKGTGHCHYSGYANPMEPCSECGGYPFTINPLLEEYVDCLHFALSIGIEHDFTKFVKWLEVKPLKTNSIVEQFNALFKADWEFYEEGNEGHYHEGLELLIGLGAMLGFSWDDVETAYYEKNKINHSRQENNY